MALSPRVERCRLVRDTVQNPATAHQRDGKPSSSRPSAAASVPRVTVDVRLFAAAREAAGVRSTEVAAGTLASVLAQLTERFPDLASVLERCSFLVDGTAVHGLPDSVQVPAGSELDVLPPFAGG